MDYKKLAKSLLCNGFGVGEDTNGCANKKCKYCDVDGVCDLNHMCRDAAIAINDLLVENQALRNAANGFKKQLEAAESRAEKAEMERDISVEQLHHCENNCDYCRNRCECDKETCFSPSPITGEPTDCWEWCGLEE